MTSVQVQGLLQGMTIGRMNDQNLSMRLGTLHRGWSKRASKHRRGRVPHAAALANFLSQVMLEVQLTLAAVVDSTAVTWVLLCSLNLPTAVSMGPFRMAHLDREHPTGLLVEEAATSQHRTLA